MAWITRKIAKCDHPGCEHEWIPTVENPVHCPGCHRRTWNRSVTPANPVGRPKTKKEVKAK